MNVNINGVQDRIVQTKETMDERSQRRLTISLTNYVSNALLICLRLQSRKLMLKKYFSIKFFCLN